MSIKVINTETTDRGTTVNFEIVHAQYIETSAGRQYSKTGASVTRKGNGLIHVTCGDKRDGGRLFEGFADALAGYGAESMRGVITVAMGIIGVEAAA